MYGYDHSGMGLGMLLVWLLPLALVVLVALYFINGKGRRRSRTALEILEERYARGEIDRDEYLKRRADLDD